MMVDDVTNESVSPRFVMLYAQSWKVVKRDGYLHPTERKPTDITGAQWSDPRDVVITKEKRTKRYFSA